MDIETPQKLVNGVYGEVRMGSGEIEWSKRARLRKTAWRDINIHAACENAERHISGIWLSVVLYTAGIECLGGFNNIAP